MMPRTAFVMLAPRRWNELCQFYRGFGRMVPRHCERSEAIHPSTCGAMDCFVAALLAMTKLLRRLRRAKLAGDHALERRDRLEILRRDLVLRNGEIELG